MVSHLRGLTFDQLDELGTSVTRLAEVESLSELAGPSLDLVASALGATVGVFILDPCMKQPDSRKLTVYGMSDPVRATYVDRYYIKNHPFHAWYDAHSRQGWPSAIFGLEDMVSECEYVAHPCYQEFQRPLGIHHTLAMTFGRHGRALGMIGLFRPRQEARFGHEDLLKARFLQPVIELNLDRLVARSDPENLLPLFHLFSPLAADEGLVLLDAGFGILKTNAAARGVLAAMEGRGVEPAAGVLPKLLRERLRETGSALVRGDEQSWRVKLPGVASFVQVTLTRLPGDSTDCYLLRLDPCNRLLSDAARLRQAGLTLREIDVLDCIRHGLKNQQISAQLSISLYTVQSHLKSIYRKLGVVNRTGALEAALPRQPATSPQDRR